MAKTAAKGTAPASKGRKITKATNSTSTGANSEPASRLIDKRIRELGGWRGETLARMRKLILEADPEITEEVKWVKPSNPSGVPVWSRAGIVCTGEVYAKAVKLTFAHGASIPDPADLFNASLEGNLRRAIDIHEGEKVDASAFKALVQAAVAANLGAKARVPKTKVPKKGAANSQRATRGEPSGARSSQDVVLLSGGNPQIAKGDGDGPVQAYIAAMPGWKSELGRRLDALIVRSVPNVRKAVRWNSPFYGLEGQGWFVSFHCFAKYIKLTFLRGTSLRPQPPVESKHPDTRYFHIHEGDELDERLLTSWLKQAAKLPGDPLF